MHGLKAKIADDDVVLPFKIEPYALRGRLVRLGPALDAILHRHAYPRLVAGALAEAIAMAAALAATLKYDGVFSIQTKGDGPLRMLVCDVTSAGAIRGYAQFDEARIASLGDGPVSVPRLFGAGYLAFTVDQGADMERYQGIVELTGATLAECAHHYFHQSEQFEAGLNVAVSSVADADGRLFWRAGAIMIQRLPPEDAQGSAEGRVPVARDPAVREAEEEGWRRAMILMGSAKSRELVDPDLPPWKLVDRLFLAEGVEIYRPIELVHRCRCDPSRMRSVLRTIARAELETMREADGAIRITCEFCNTAHAFADLDAIYDGT
ncbi:MAG: Hsp33 family molecular chaperone HslO [Proteobacteria bacterium]|nr:Hsp33 family molecular chaperone HslO [Pseudomonadota bacterium]